MRRIVVFSKKSKSSFFKEILDTIYQNHYLKTFEDFIELVKFSKKNIIHYLIIDDEIVENSSFLLDFSQKFPETNLVAIVGKEKTSYISTMVKANYSGIILNTNVKQELNKAIESIEEKLRFFSNELSPIVLRIITENDLNNKKTNHNLKILTKREKQILELILEELTNHEIAEKLFVSPRTIDSHRRNLLQKTNSKNTVGLIKFAYKNEII